MILLEVAQQIAQDEVAHRRSLPRLAGYDFGPVVLESEGDGYWKFVCASDRMQEEGYVPGAIFVRVDKRDGHVWSENETEQYY
ncbi:MAG: hypothetical protein ACRD9Y_23970, partial [Blastocatellia bacterium]